MKAVSAACSCGIEGCRERGWPHEWDPIEAGDDCVIGGLGGSPHIFGTVLPGGRGVGRQGHKVEAPYVRHGSGYACSACVDDSGPEAM